MKRPNRVKRFAGGGVLGVLVFVLAIAGIYAGRIAGEKALDLLDFKNRREKIDYRFLKHDFHIGFEREKDLKVFQARQAAAKKSTEHATQGNYSLWVEIPAGRKYPGIATEVYGKDCFDWSDMTEFTFDVHNERTIPAPITIKIKSGRDDPKEQYETGIAVPARKTGRVRITRRELEHVLDLRCISAINIFMQDPRTTFYLYFDNFSVKRGHAG